MYLPKNLIILVELLLFTHLFVTPSQPLSQPNHVPLPTTTKLHNHNHDHESSLFCETWRFSVETNNAGNWSTVPVRCYKYVMDYMTGDRYVSDFGLAAKNALDYAKSVDIAGDGMDAWIFDVDETLLSTFPYYKVHGFGKKNRTEFIKWGLGKGTKLPVLKASLSLYKEVRKLGFTIFLLTGRPEWIRNSSVTNLMDVGYSHWKRLILRQPSDENKTAIDYKSENRKKLVDQGYRIHGNSGDQWSDLLGYAMAQRSFKFPNPMYYVA